MHDRWIALLASLPTQGNARELLADFMVRSGELKHGWAHACQWTKDALSWLLDNGYIKAEKTPTGVFFTNFGSGCTAEHRIHRDNPTLFRHAVPTMLPRSVKEEMDIMSSVKWTLCKEIFPIFVAMDTQSKKDMAAIKELRKSKTFISVCDEALSLPHFYIPIFLDWVGRSYGEGILSYTGNHLVRSSLRLKDQVRYSRKNIRRICHFIKFPMGDVESILKNAEVDVSKRGLKAFGRISTALWVLEALKTGKSGALCSSDFRTSGPMIAAILILCIALLNDTNVWGEDDRDLRKVIAGRVVVPSDLKKWENEILKLVMKPLITQLFYGQAAHGGAEGLLWANPDSKELLGWISPLGRVDTDRVLSLKHMWHPDLADITEELGPQRAWAAYKSLSTQFNSAFWKSYPEVLEIRQRLQKLEELTKKTTGGSIVLKAPNGWEYTHQKWVIKDGGEPWRFRYAGPGCDRPLDITLVELTDTASGFSLFVRMIHMLDAWLRNQINLEIVAEQERIFGRYVGHASVHDAFLVPYIMAPMMHRIVRRVMHRAVNILPYWFNDQFTSRGMEAPININPETLRRVHTAISRNTAWLQIG